MRWILAALVLAATAATDAQAQLALTPQEIWQACQAGDYPECVHCADLLAGGRGVT